MLSKRLPAVRCGSFHNEVANNEFLASARFSFTFYLLAAPDGIGKDIAIKKIHCLVSTAKLNYRISIFGTCYTLMVFISGSIWSHVPDRHGVLLSLVD